MKMDLQLSLQHRLFNEENLLIILKYYLTSVMYKDIIGLMFEKTLKFHNIYARNNIAGYMNNRLSNLYSRNQEFQVCSKGIFYRIKLSTNSLRI